MARNYAYGECPWVGLAVIPSGGTSLLEVVRNEESSADQRTVFVRKTIHGQNAQWRFATEVLAMQASQHHHVPRVHDFYRDHDGRHSIVMFPYASTDLRNIFPRRDRISKKLLTRMFGCLAATLCSIHEALWIHKDIKPSNVLIHDENVYLADFGSATRSGTTGLVGHQETGSEMYSPPEVFNEEPRDEKSDIFMLGCTFVEIFRKAWDPRFRLPVDHNRRYSAELNILQHDLREYGRDRRNEKAARTIADVCHRMISYDREDRPTAQEVADELRELPGAHEFFCEKCFATDSSEEEEEEEEESDDEGDTDEDGEEDTDEDEQEGDFVIPRARR
jgi:serine/threonine protein kinase